MSFLAIPYPVIDPIMFEVGPLAIRWYSMAYIGGLLFAWYYMVKLVARSPEVATRADIDDFIVWATAGIIVGGRMGYVLFYNPGFYMDNPVAALRLWDGGMSFHGGVLGVLAATVIFVRRRSIPLARFADIITCSTPIGLFLGRLANFINGELYGRVSDVQWAMVFPRGGPAPRHPSQLYEAALEGVALFVLLYVLSRNETYRNRPGFLTGVFLLGYSAARGFVELFRQPDAHLGFLAAGLTMGQWLTVPMVLAGLYLVLRKHGEA